MEKGYVLGLIILFSFILLPNAFAVTCVKDSDCGANTNTGSPYCQDGDVYQHYISNKCVPDPKSIPPMSCMPFLFTKKTDDCSSNEICSNGACKTSGPTEPNFSIEQLYTTDSLDGSSKNKFLLNEPVFPCIKVSNAGKSGSVIVQFIVGNLSQTKSIYIGQNKISEPICGIQWSSLAVGNYTLIGKLNTEDCTNCGDTFSFTIQKIVCSKNSDCGINGYIGSKFCSNNNVYQQYKTYTCNNAGKVNASCSNSTQDKIAQTCLGNQKCDAGSCKTISCAKNSDCGTDGYIGAKFCKNGDVFQQYKTFTCNSAGTPSAACLNSFQDKLIEDCQSPYTCDNAECILPLGSCASHTDCSGNDVCYNNKCTELEGLFIASDLYLDAIEYAENNNISIHETFKLNALKVFDAVQNMETANLYVLVAGNSVATLPKLLMNYNTKFTLKEGKLFMTTWKSNTLASKISGTIADVLLAKQIVSTTKYIDGLLNFAGPETGPIISLLIGLQKGSGNNAVDYAWNSFHFAVADFITTPYLLIKLPGQFIQGVFGPNAVISSAIDFAEDIEKTYNEDIFKPICLKSPEGYIKCVGYLKDLFTHSLAIVENVDITQTDTKVKFDVKIKNYFKKSFLDSTGEIWVGGTILTKDFVDCDWQVNPKKVTSVSGEEMTVSLEYNKIDPLGNKTCPINSPPKDEQLTFVAKTWYTCVPYQCFCECKLENGDFCTFDSCPNSNVEITQLAELYNKGVLKCDGSYSGNTSVDLFCYGGEASMGETLNEGALSEFSTSFTIQDSPTSLDVQSPTEIFEGGKVSITVISSDADDTFIPDVEIDPTNPNVIEFEKNCDIIYNGDVSCTYEWLLKENTVGKYHVKFFVNNNAVSKDIYFTITENSPVLKKPADGECLGTQKSKFTWETSISAPDYTIKLFEGSENNLKESIEVKGVIWSNNEWTYPQVPLGGPALSKDTYYWWQVVAHTPFADLTSGKNKFFVDCWSNEVCGTDGYTGDILCGEDGHLYQNYQTFTCKNPGKENSQCTNSTIPKKVQTCSSGCVKNDLGNNICLLEEICNNGIDDDGDGDADSLDGSCEGKICGNGKVWMWSDMPANDETPPALPVFWFPMSCCQPTQCTKISGACFNFGTFDKLYVCGFNNDWDVCKAATIGSKSDDNKLICTANGWKEGQCINDSGCPANNSCTNNFCVLKQGCQYDNPKCGGGFACVNNGCVQNKGCAYNNPACDDGFKCIDNACVAVCEKAVKCNGQEVVQVNENCSETLLETCSKKSICSEGTCKEVPCFANADCGKIQWSNEGQICKQEEKALYKTKINPICMKAGTPQAYCSSNKSLEQYMSCLFGCNGNDCRLMSEIKKTMDSTKTKLKNYNLKKFYKWFSNKLPKEPPVIPNDSGNSGDGNEEEKACMDLDGENIHTASYVEYYTLINGVKYNKNTLNDSCSYADLSVVYESVCVGDMWEYKIIPCPEGEKCQGGKCATVP